MGHIPEQRRVLLLVTNIMIIMSNQFVQSGWIIRYINRIIISGNTRTLDKVIRRTIRLSEGDPYNRNLVKRSEDLVRNLGHFSLATIDVEDNFEQQDTVDLNVTVKEQSTGSLMLGGGFSSSVGATANIGISESNLLGKSQKVRLNLLATSKYVSEILPRSSRKTSLSSFRLSRLSQSLQESGLISSAKSILLSPLSRGRPNSNLKSTSVIPTP